MGFNPSQPRQAGGKFGTTGAQKPTPTYKTAAAIPASAISPQLMAQAQQMLAQQAAAVKSQGKLTPAQRQYLRTLGLARRLLMKQQSTRLAAERKQAAAAKKRAAAVKARAAKQQAAAAKGAAAGRQGRQGPKVSAPKAGKTTVASGKVMSNLQQYLAHP